MRRAILVTAAVAAGAVGCLQGLSPFSGRTEKGDCPSGSPLVPGNEGDSPHFRKQQRKQGQSPDGGGDVPDYPRAAGGGDWPQFRGPARDGVAPGVKLPDDWPRALRTLWKVPLGEGYASPAVARGRVFVLAQDGEEEAALCLDAASGKRLWRQAWRARFRSSYGGGPRAAAAVDGDRVYFVGATGEMACLGAGDGKIV